MQATIESAVQQAPASTGPTQRLVSIDALRGFDMFWIIGADAVVRSLHQVSDMAGVRVLAEQMEHVAWEGFHFYDLIFPLFIFLVGTSSVFSLQRIVEQQGRGAAHRRLFRRAILLYALGLLYYGGLSRDGGPEMFRYVGVLQRIAICYLLGGLALLHLRWRGLSFLCATLLIGYWALMTFVPVPGLGAGDFVEGRNLANYFDQQYLPGYKWDGAWDPEGILSTLPAVASGILGIMAGLLMRNPNLTASRRLGSLVVLGLAGLLLGWLWGLQFPVIKKLWTSSYVLLAAGWSFLLVALFHLVIDIWRIDRWARPFVWIGMNPITIYLLAELVGFRQLVRRVIHQPLIDRIDPAGELLISCLALALAVGICYLLYRKRIFLRL